MELYEKIKAIINFHSPCVLNLIPWNENDPVKNWLSLETAGILFKFRNAMENKLEFDTS